MQLLFSYSWRNVFKRRMTLILTVTGVALVVFVFSAVRMLSHGLNRTLVDTGHDGNVTIIRRAAQTEVSSILPRSMGNIVKTDVGIARDSADRPLVTGELLVLISQPKRGSGESGNVPVRGTTEISFILRPEVKLIEGRLPRPGTAEIMAGAKLARNFQGCGVGETVRFGARDWEVVGVFEANGAGFESELWGDYDQFADAFERPIYSSLTARLATPEEFAAMKDRLENDPRLTVEIDREKEYYAKQSRFTRTYITVLGSIISFIFGFGAIFGAMITMYAAVANRTTEIGTLRALGFSRLTVLLTFLAESLTIALLGGVLGVVVAYFLRFFEVSTTNWDTFSELAFSFEISPSIILEALVFVVIMGLLGGFLPAARAASMRIVNSLRAR